MKFALFEFAIDKRCEIGESRWIKVEDSQVLNKEQSFSDDNEIMVQWPCDSVQILERIKTMSVDINTIEHMPFAAKVLQLSDSYEELLRQLTRHSNNRNDKGCVNKRKALKKRNTGENIYMLQSADTHDVPIEKIREENVELKKQLEMNTEEIRRLRRMIISLQELSDLPHTVEDLKIQVERLRRYNNNQQLTNDSFEILTETIHGVDQIAFIPHVKLTQGQIDTLKNKKVAKDFIYSIMDMLWDRNVFVTHSISGKRSNAFKDKEAKPALDQDKVASICEYAAEYYGISVAEAKCIMRAKLNNVTKAEKLKLRHEQIQGKSRVKESLD